MKIKVKYIVILFSLSFILALGLFARQEANSFIIDSKIHHVVERLSFGATPGDLTRIKSEGIDLYIEQQLSPEDILESPYLLEKLAELKTIELSPMELFSSYARTTGMTGRNLSEQERRKEGQRLAMVGQEAINAHLLRSIYGAKQLEEVMTDFWFNHFNVFIGKGQETRLWVGNYENEAIRPNALGNFRDLLEATATHPAMLFYLDNWRNTDPLKGGKRVLFQGLNENYARELLELHTLGVEGGYSQEDVTTLARILTGWGVARRERGIFYFDATRHDFADKVFLGQGIKGAGVSEVEEAFDILASHAATARHISYKLAQYFLADEPPEALVKKLAQTFLSSGGDIRRVLMSLFSSREFFDDRYYQQKFKNPYQYLISVVRATGVEKANLRMINGMLQQLNMGVYGCATPDGYKNTQEGWLNPDAMLRRLSFATAIANGNLSLDTKKPVNAEELMNTLGNQFSTHTKNVISKSPPAIKSAIILGSPEMMYK
jgi:uncharacterized protein (DUF1800 family)